MAGALRLASSAVVISFAISGCGSTSPKPDSGLGALWGTVELVRRPDLPAPRGGGSSYGSRRLRDVQLVDYSTAESTVVYLEGRPSPTGIAEIQVRTSWGGPVLSPERSVIGSGGGVRIENRTEGPQVISCPALGWVQKIEAGGTLDASLESVAPDRAELVTLHLLGAGDASASILACPGPFVIPREGGRWELTNLPPGPGRLHLWHPRFPSVLEEIDVVAGQAHRVDLRIGPARVSLSREETADGAQ